MMYKIETAYSDYKKTKVNVPEQWEFVEEIIQDISSLRIKNKAFKREHKGITQVSFSNPITNRRNPYEEYKNEKGLYEPRTPRKGMKIKED